MPGQRLLVITVLIIAVLTNFLGSFIPETGFDALWYHLTIPKLYLEVGKPYFIPGGLLYYSAMPRLIEFIYLVGMKQWGWLWPHLVNFVFGLGAAVVTYRLGRVFLSPQKSLLATAVFYITPTVGWLSNSAYIDLPRTFFEVLAVYLLFARHYALSAVILGLALSTKILAFGSLPVLTIVMFLQERSVGRAFLYCFLTLFVVSPWIVFSYLSTGYPFYPIGAGIFDSVLKPLPDIFRPWTLFSDLFKVSVQGDDLLTPLYFIILPFIALTFKLQSKKAKLLIFLTLLSYLAWWSIPKTGGGRFFLPYTPLWAIVIVLTWDKVKVRLVKRVLLGTILLLLVLNCFYRIASVARSLPVIMGMEPHDAYLCRTLEFGLGTFYDCDHWFRANISTTDLVYVQGVHNLYYLEFPFVHESYYQGEEATHLLLQGNTEPLYRGKIVSESNLIHRDPLTNTKVYKL